jgi:hypothetical protein
MPSHKSSGVSSERKKPDNQQERLKTVGWVVGYVDGEGCFSVSLVKNATTKYGWQVFPEFVVTQGGKSERSLKLLQKHFGCGSIFVNRRYDNHREHIYRYCVRSRKELKERILPFFRENPLRTAKQEDFRHFCRILDQMDQGKHLTEKGLMIIAKRIEKMNRKKPSRFLESQETIR